MNLLPGLETTASALNAEKTRLDVIGQNIANANTTKGPDGKPYARQTVSFESKLIELGKRQDGSMTYGQGVAIKDISTDNTPGQMIKNPGHPDADENVMILNVVTIKDGESIEDATINLIGPIVVNRKTFVGKQIVVSNYHKFSAHHPILAESVER